MNKKRKTLYSQKKQLNTTTPNPQPKLYSIRSILIATFFGAPLAAGILVRQNYINLSEEKKGNTALIIGIISTILLFGSIFLIPESIIDKIPHFIIPTVYMAIIYAVLDRKYGKTLKQHEKENGAFYSGWRAAAIGLGCAVVTFGSIFAYVYLTDADFMSETYNQGIDEFQQNEKEALRLYDLNMTESTDVISRFIITEGLPLWERNLQIMTDLDTISGLPDDLKLQNEKLRYYSRLRIAFYKTYKNALLEDTDQYHPILDSLDLEINRFIDGE